MTLLNRFAKTVGTVGLASILGFNQNSVNGCFQSSEDESGIKIVAPEMDAMDRTCSEILGEYGYEFSQIVAPEMDAMDRTCSKILGEYGFSVELEPIMQGEVR